MFRINFNWFERGEGNKNYLIANKIWLWN